MSPISRLVSMKEATTSYLMKMLVFRQPLEGAIDWTDGECEKVGLELFSFNIHGYSETLLKGMLGLQCINVFKVRGANLRF